MVTITSQLLFFVIETWRSAQGDEAETVELAPSGFGVKTFPSQSHSCGGGIVTTYKSILGSNITFIAKFDFAPTSSKIVQTSITSQQNTQYFFLFVPPSNNRQNNRTDSMSDLLD